MQEGAGIDMEPEEAAAEAVNSGLLSYAQFWLMGRPDYVATARTLPSAV